MLKAFFNKHIIYLLYFLIITSSVLDYRLIPFDSNLNYIRVGVLLLNGLFLLYAFIHKLKIHFDNLFFVFIGYSVFKLLSVFYALNPIDTLFVFIFWINISFLYLTFLNLTFLHKYLIDIKKVIIISALINSLVALIQAFLFINYDVKILNIYGWKWPYGFRVTGLSFDANHLAAFVLLGFFISLNGVITNIKFKYKIIYAFLCLVFLGVFYYSSSRSSFLGLIIGVLAFAVFYILKYSYFKFFTKSLVLLIPVIFILIFLLFPSLFNLKQENRLKELNNVIYNVTSPFLIHGRGLDSSAFAHFSLIYSSFYLSISNNFLGVGAGNFSEGIQNDKFLTDVFSKTDPDVLSKPNFPAHSMYGEALGEGGPIGLFLFFTILFLIVNKYLKILKTDKSVFPFFIYFYSVLFFMLFYNINEEFFWLFVFLGLSLNPEKQARGEKVKG